MNAINRFNPLTYSNKLKEVGVSDKQAEMFAQLQDEIINGQENELVTKLFLMQSLTVKISELEIKLIKWMIGISFAQLGLVLTLMKYFIKV